MSAVSKLGSSAQTSKVVATKDMGTLTSQYGNAWTVVEEELEDGRRRLSAKPAYDSNLYGAIANIHTTVEQARAELSVGINTQEYEERLSVRIALAITTSYAAAVGLYFTGHKKTALAAALAPSVALGAYGVAKGGSRQIEGAIGGAFMAPMHAISLPGAIYKTPNPLGIRKVDRPAVAMLKEAEGK